MREGWQSYGCASHRAEKVERNMDNNIEPWLLRWLASSNLDNQQLKEIGDRYGISVPTLKLMIQRVRYEVNRMEQ